MSATVTTKGKKPAANLKPSPVLEASYHLARRNRWPWMWAGHSELPPWWKSETEMITEPRRVIGACLSYLVQHMDDFPDNIDPNVYTSTERPGDIPRFRQRVADCLYMVIHWWGDQVVDEIRDLCSVTSVRDLGANVINAHKLAVKAGFLVEARKKSNKPRTPRRPGEVPLRLWAMMIKTPEMQPNGMGLTDQRIGDRAGVGIGSARLPLRRMRSSEHLVEAKNGWRLSQIGLRNIRLDLKKWGDPAGGVS